MSTANGDVNLETAKEFAAQHLKKMLDRHFETSEEEHLDLTHRGKVEEEEPNQQSEPELAHDSNNNESIKPTTLEEEEEEKVGDLSLKSEEPTEKNNSSHKRNESTNLTTFEEEVGDLQLKENGECDLSPPLSSPEVASSECTLNNATASQPDTEHEAEIAECNGNEDVQEQFLVSEKPIVEEVATPVEIHIEPPASPPLAESVPEPNHTDFERQPPNNDESSVVPEPNHQQFETNAAKEDSAESKDESPVPVPDECELKLSTDDNLKTIDEESGQPVETVAEQIVEKVVNEAQSQTVAAPEPGHQELTNEPKIVDETKTSNNRMIDEEQERKMLAKKIDENWWNMRRQEVEAEKELLPKEKFVTVRQKIKKGNTRSLKEQFEMLGKGSGFKE